MIVEVGWHFASLHRFWNLSAYEFIASVFLNDSTLFLGVLIICMILLFVYQKMRFFDGYIFHFPYMLTCLKYKHDFCCIKVTLLWSSFSLLIYKLVPV